MYASLPAFSESSSECIFKFTNIKLFTRQMEGMSIKDTCTVEDDKLSTSFGK